MNAFKFFRWTSPLSTIFHVASLKPTWSFRSRLWKPGTALANSVSSVTVSTDVLWQQWKSLASASLCWSSPQPTAGTSSPAWRPLSGSGLSPFTMWAANVFSASWNVSISWMMKGCWERRGQRGCWKVRIQINNIPNPLFSALSCPLPACWSFRWVWAVP